MLDFKKGFQRLAAIPHLIGAERKINSIPLLTTIYVISANEGSILSLRRSGVDVEQGH